MKQGLVASERAMLWSWHRIQLEDPTNRPQYYERFSELWRAYKQAAHRYFEKLQRHFHVRDGLSGYCRENAEFALVVFEQIGLIATIGLSQILVATDQNGLKFNLENANVVADGLAQLIANNPVSGSPRLDGNAIDVTLGMLLLTATDHMEAGRLVPSTQSRP